MSRVMCALGKITAKRFWQSMYMRSGAASCDAAGAAKNGSTAHDKRVATRIKDVDMTTSLMVETTPASRSETITAGRPAT
jgi:hypothetical protein